MYRWIHGAGVARNKGYHIFFLEFSKTKTVLICIVPCEALHPYNSILRQISPNLFHVIGFIRTSLVVSGVAR